jgi:hypothetical protein
LLYERDLHHIFAPTRCYDWNDSNRRNPDGSYIPRKRREEIVWRSANGAVVPGNAPGPKEHYRVIRNISGDTFYVQPTDKYGDADEYAGTLIVRGTHAGIANRTDLPFIVHEHLGKF